MIKIENLTKGFGRTKVFQELDLEIGTGIYGLLGANGAGKTTLMRCITGVYENYKGKIYYNGANVKDSGVLDKNLGYLPQKFGTFKKLTVTEALEYAALLKEMPKDKIPPAMERALELIHLEEEKSKKVGALSGGMLRRLGIGCAIISDPDVLIVDEPTAGLDPEERARFKTLISSLGRERTVIISTHIVEDVEALCDKIIVIDKGNILFKDDAEKLRELAKSKVFLIPLEKEKDIPQGAFVVRRTGAGTDAVARTLCAEPIGEAAAEYTVEDGYLSLVKGI